VEGERSRAPIPITLKVYNILGRLVRILVDEEKIPGNYEAVWDGKDSQGKEVSSGIYFYRLDTENYRRTKRMTLVK
jgi:flagellar hook assembly protein FlgD